MTAGAPAPPPEAGRVSVVEGYRPGAIGRIAALHADYYSRHWGLGLAFEAKVARDAAAFALRMDPARDRWWLVLDESEGRAICGSLAIDGSEADDGTAHLRWFIMADRTRGRGLGESMMRRATGFCREAGFAAVYLWTFAGLDAARHLYERHGFRLAEQLTNDQWGMPLPEQRFVLPLANASHSGPP